MSVEYFPLRSNHSKSIIINDNERSIMCVHERWVSWYCDFVEIIKCRFY